MCPRNRSSLVFPANARASPPRVEFVTDALIAAGATRVLHDARLLVSELATNAVVHANTDFSVSVHISAGRVYVEVRDGDRREVDVAAEREISELAISGQGLRIVGRLAGSWGTRVEDHGKVVWFSVDA